MNAFGNGKDLMSGSRFRRMSFFSRSGTLSLRMTGSSICSVFAKGTPLLITDAVPEAVCGKLLTPSALRELSMPSTFMMWPLMRRRES